MENPKGTLLSRLFDQDPYAGFPAGNFTLGRHGLNLPVRALSLVNEVKPSRIIEVGTWQGASAFFMADRLRGLGVEFEMVCVDTWLGSREMWNPAERDIQGCYTALKIKHGRPTVYDQFITNVIRKGYTRQIVPFPVTSAIACRVLAAMGYSAQFIYIDGSHDPPDVLRDVFDYWELVEPGGILCGDDYGWRVPGIVPAVDTAVARLAAEVGCALECTPADHSWWIRKP
jgi:hypothetical protein